MSSTVGLGHNCRDGTVFGRAVEHRRSRFGLVALAPRRAQGCDVGVPSVLWVARSSSSEFPTDSDAKGASIEAKLSFASNLDVDQRVSSSPDTPLSRHYDHASSPRPVGPPTSSQSYSHYYKATHLVESDRRNADNSNSNVASSQAPAATVQEAMERTKAALEHAESAFHSDSPPKGTGLLNSTFRFLEVSIRLAQIPLLCLILVASHAFGLHMQWLGAVMLSSAIASWSYHRKALSMSGAVAAAVVGAGTLGCSLRFGATLIAFFLSSSKLTQYKIEIKQVSDDSVAKGARRDWLQVFCNGLVPTILSIAYGILVGCVDLPMGPLPSLEPARADLVTLFMGSFLGYYACCCGDTWASELGVLSKYQPRLITTLRPVRPGTNGGVTLTGLSASVLGGMFVGIVFYLSALVSPTLWIFDTQRQIATQQWLLIVIGLAAGLFGSLLDSLLGATLQFTGYDTVAGRVTSKPGPGVARISGIPLLTNNMVNLVSASIMSLLTGLVCLKIFG